jgi:hypothetical protein
MGSLARQGRGRDMPRPNGIERGSSRKPVGRGRSDPQPGVEAPPGAGPRPCRACPYLYPFPFYLPLPPTDPTQPVSIHPIGQGRRRPWAARRLNRRPDRCAPAARRPGPQAPQRNGIARGPEGTTERARNGAGSRRFVATPAVFRHLPIEKVPVFSGFPPGNPALNIKIARKTKGASGGEDGDTAYRPRGVEGGMKMSLSQMKSDLHDRLGGTTERWFSVGPGADEISYLPKLLRSFRWRASSKPGRVDTGHRPFDNEIH